MSVGRLPFRLAAAFTAEIVYPVRASSPAALAAIRGATIRADSVHVPVVPASVSMFHVPMVLKGEPDCDKSGEQSGNVRVRCCS